MRVRLAPGVDPQRAINELTHIAGSTSGAIRPAALHESDKRNDYIQWATWTEARLEGLLRREDARAIFDTPRHHDISTSSLGEHLKAMLYAELNAKQRDFQEIVDYLTRQVDRMRSAPGLPVVVDSNVLLQGERPDNVNWKAELKTDVRLIVPLRVIEEIDAKKYSDSKRLRDRARSLLPWFNGLFPDTTTGPVPIRPDKSATIEVLVADRPRTKPVDADEEVLDACQDVMRFAGQAKLMTGDTAMRLRAIAEGLDVFFLPPGWRRMDLDGHEPAAPI
jgi:hypothetical protein